MARFGLTLVAGSTRWIAPAVVYLVGAGLVLANPGPMRANAVFFFPLHEVVLCWLAVVAGNIDDDGHRELCTAAVGSPGRLVVARALTALAIALALAALSTAASAAIALGRSESVGSLAGVFVLQVAAGTVGTGIGALLHRPLVRSVGISVLFASLALVLAIATGPVTSTLRAFADGDDLAAVVALTAAAALGAVLVSAAAVLSGPAAR